MSAPIWLARYMTTTGAPDPRRVGRAARPRGCPRCGRLVLVGEDHHRMAAVVTVDPYALKTPDEVKAILDGIATYELNGEPPAWELRPRTIPTVPLIGKRSPAESVRVVAAHRCGRPPLTRDALPTRAPPLDVDDDEPPY